MMNYYIIFKPDLFKILFTNITQNTMNNNHTNQDNESVYESEKKVAVITGSSKGIGKAIALNFAKSKEYSSIVINSRRIDEAELVVQEIKKTTSCDSIAIPGDVAQEKDCIRLIGETVDKFQRLDVLVNNAGIGIFGKVEKTSIEDIEKVSFTNYFGMIYFTKIFLDSMIRRNSGHIINVASLASSFGIPGMAAYCGSKFAMLGFSESLRRELRKTGVKISVISPIGVKTNFFNNEYFNNKTPMKYMLNPETVSKSVLNSLTSDSFQIFVPTIAGLSVPFKGWFPAIIDSIIERQFRKKLG